MLNVVMLSVVAPKNYTPCELRIYLVIIE